MMVEGKKESTFSIFGFCTWIKRAPICAPFFS
jgi:hypothetical protein